MSRRSGSKQNINTSYYDLTSPLTNLEKAKQKSALKTSIHNSFIGKIQIYSQNDTHNLPKTSLKPHPNYVHLKADSQIYKLPQFTVPQINYEISQAIKQKTSEIRQEMVTNLPNILSSSQSLPSLTPKSSNYNPKKLQNNFGHRSSIIELQAWIKSSLKKSLPTTPEQLIEYKQMIMGVGMKELIRIINLRCLEEGKLVEQVWQLTWGICKQIIQHMALRARKCEEILTQQIIEFNQGCKRNYFVKEKQLIELRKKIKVYEEQHIDMNDKIEELTRQNEKLSVQSNKNYLNHNYVNEEFLNVLQENLAMYLHLGDKSKRDWIKKMYKQVAKSRDSIKNSLKQKVNKTMSNRIRHEQSFGDNDEKQLQLDEHGNFIVQRQKPINQNGSINQNSETQQCEELKDQLLKEFEARDTQTQTDIVEKVEIDVQYEGAVYEEKQTETQMNLVEEIGVNTDSGESSEKSAKQKQIKQNKSKKQKPSVSKSLKPKISKRGSIITDSLENKIISAPIVYEVPVNNVIVQEQSERIQTIQIIQYICKDCFIKKSKEEALLEIQFKQEQQRIKNENAKLRAKRNDSSGQTDSQGEKVVVVRKNDIKTKTFIVKTSTKDFNREQSSLQKSMIKGVLQNIDETKGVQNHEISGETTARLQNDGYPEFPVDSNGSPSKRKKQRRDSSLLHDIGIIKQIQQATNLKETVFNYMKSMQEQKNVMARLPLCSKEPYFKFFTQQITEANKQLINQIMFQQSNNENVLNNYFSIVQEVNTIPESRIQMSEKQMLTTIEKNLMPIILELLNNVKKSVIKKTVDQAIKSFPSLPFILMNKFSTKYGVRILAIKNMKLVLSSLKKIELTTDRYKSIRLMLFTDCRAMYSEDLFVYLLVLATITPHLDIEKSISCGQVAEVREICEKYLTTQKRVYEQFDNMTKEALSLNNSQDKLTHLKLTPLLRSIITSYRIVKINRIEEVGFLFLMLKKDNSLEYLTFSYFLSSFNIDTDTKVTIVKAFLANCDLKTKNKRIAISQSAFSRFLIRCPQFNFDFLNIALTKQKQQIDRNYPTSTKKVIPTGKRMSQQFSLKKQGSYDNIISFALLRNEDEMKSKKKLGKNSDSQLQTEKAILIASQRQLAERLLAVQQDCQEQREYSNRNEENLDLKNISQQKVEIEEQESIKVRNQKRHLSLVEGNEANRSKCEISDKLKHYSYFTYEIVKFMEDEEETKYMTKVQREFVANYLLVHVMACEVEEMIGLIDYFSNDMLEIVCFNGEDLKVQG